MADIVCPILSCKNCNVEGISVDPFENAKAFDENGYKLLSCLRIIGLPKTVGILQDLELIAEKKRVQVKKLFQRFFSSELGEEEKFLNFDAEKSSIVGFLRTLGGVNEVKIASRENRGYMLVDRMTVLDETVGFISFNTIKTRL